MQHALHLLIVDPQREACLAACFGSRWLLPVLTCAERVRAEPAILRWVTDHGIPCDVVGQWLGSVGSDVIDWLVAIRANTSMPPAPAHLRWAPLRCLSATIPLIDYQGWALARSLERGSLPSVPGPFGSLMWVEEVTNWITAAGGTAPSSLIPYRVGPHELVLGASTPSGRLYFKGLTEERAGEAHLTKTLAALAPHSFARTLVIEHRPDRSVWWLTQGCPGVAAADGTLVARALARLQRRVMASGSILRRLRDLDIDRAVRWACSFVDDAATADDIRSHAHTVRNADVPESWIPMDLDPTNVLVDEQGSVHFIDLDGSYFGPALLAMATFAKRSRDTSLYRVYEQAWSPPLTDVDWRSFEVVALVFEAWVGWLRVEQATRREEVHGVLDLAARRIRERLATVVHGR